MDELWMIPALLILFGLTVFLSSRPKHQWDKIDFPLSMANVILMLIILVVSPIALLIWAFF